MSQYKASIRNNATWRQSKAATLGISVNSPNWQEDKFAAILGFASRNFSVIRLDVTDALHRHNLMAEGIPPEQALAEANASGALWLAKHQDIINQSPVKPVIIRWGEWYSHKDYSSTLAGFTHAYTVDRAFRRAVDQDAMNFFARKQISPTVDQLKHTRDYLIEEVAVSTLQARELPSIKLYPGDDLLCLHVVRSSQVSDAAPKGLERETFGQIRFEKQKNQLSAVTRKIPAVSCVPSLNI